MPRSSWLRRLTHDATPRPYVAFAAVDEKRARRLYRAQNLVWVWLGLAATLAALSWLLRPDLGPVLLTHSPTVDAVRNGLFGVGGLLIASGVWWIRRPLEVLGHVAFASGALVNAAAMATLPGPQGVAIVTLLGVTLASGFRAFYIVRWIGSAPVEVEHAPPR